MRQVTIIVTFAWLAISSLLIPYDFVAYAKGGNDATISKVVLDNTQDFPFIPYVYGAITVGLGFHFFFSQTKPNGTGTPP